MSSTDLEISDHSASAPAVPMPDAVSSGWTEDEWERASIHCKCNELQMKYVKARLLLGFNQHNSARAAGYAASTEAALRSQASKTERSPNVQALMTYAKAGGAIPGQELSTFEGRKAYLQGLLSRNEDNLPGKTAVIKEINAMDAARAASEGEISPDDTLRELAKLSVALAALLARQENMSLPDDIPAEPLVACPHCAGMFLLSDIATFDDHREANGLADGPERTEARV